MLAVVRAVAPGQEWTQEKQQESEGSTEESRRKAEGGRRDERRAQRVEDEMHQTNVKQLRKLNKKCLSHASSSMKHSPGIIIGITDGITSNY